MTQNERPTILVLEALHGSSGAVKAQGASVISLHPTMDVEKVLDILDGTQQIDGLLLTGGGDVNPRLYHRKPHAKVYGVNDTRDTIEMLALDYAEDRNIPVMGICRGSQIMNVHSGGMMTQHIGGHSGTEHPIDIENGSYMHYACGTQYPVIVSLHHQCVKSAGKGWYIVARAKDGTPEAIESNDGRCIGVQFHPEMDRSADYSKGLFRWLVTESAFRSGLPEPELPKALTAVKSTQKTGTHGSKAAKRRNRKAGQKTFPVVSYWWCGNCGISFDNKSDYVDHKIVLHGEDRVEVMS